MPSDTIKDQLLQVIQQLDAEDEFRFQPSDQALEGIRAAQRLVDAFHLKLQLKSRQRVHQLPESPVDGGLLSHAAATLSTVAEELGKQINAKDVRPLREHLHIEEESELIAALLSRDEVEVLDALADKLYVILGTAAILDLPLAEAFVEVHNSNMTKRKQPGDEMAERVREKGSGYKPPDLTQILFNYRIKQMKPHELGLQRREQVISESSDCIFCGMGWREILKQIDKRGRASCKGGAPAKLKPSSGP